MDNVALAKSMYEAFGRGDIPTVLGTMSPDVRWSEAESNPYMPSGEPFVGPDAILEQLFMRLAADWNDFAARPKTFHGLGDSAVVAEGRYGGTHKTTGKSLDAQFCHVLEFSNGKLTRFQQYTDTTKVREAMGAD